ncbi:hypothetical protein Q5752_005216 [Cryptotrichosporon argae]
MASPPPRPDSTPRVERPPFVDRPYLHTPSRPLRAGAITPSAFAAMMAPATWSGRRSRPTSVRDVFADATAGQTAGTASMGKSPSKREPKDIPLPPSPIKRASSQAIDVSHTAASRVAEPVPFVSSPNATLPPSPQPVIAPRPAPSASLTEAVTTLNASTSYKRTVSTHSSFPRANTSFATAPAMPTSPTKIALPPSPALSPAKVAPPPLLTPSRTERRPRTSSPNSLLLNMGEASMIVDCTFDLPSVDDSLDHLPVRGPHRAQALLKPAESRTAAPLSRAPNEPADQSSLFPSSPSKLARFFADATLSTSADFLGPAMPDGPSMWAPAPAVAPRTLRWPQTATNDESMDINQLIQGLAKVKRPSGTEESFVDLLRAAPEDLDFSLADADESFLPPELKSGRKPQPARSHGQPMPNRLAAALSSGQATINRLRTPARAQADLALANFGTGRSARVLSPSRTTLAQLASPSRIASPSRTTLAQLAAATRVASPGKGALAVASATRTLSAAQTPSTYSGTTDLAGALLVPMSRRVCDPAPKATAGSETARATTAREAAAADSVSPTATDDAKSASSRRATHARSGSTASVRSIGPLSKAAAPSGTDRAGLRLGQTAAATGIARADSLSARRTASQRLSKPPTAPGPSSASERTRSSVPLSQVAARTSQLPSCTSMLPSGTVAPRTSALPSRTAKSSLPPPTAKSSLPPPAAKSSLLPSATSRTSLVPARKASVPPLTTTPRMRTGTLPSAVVASATGTTGVGAGAGASTASLRARIAEATTAPRARAAASTAATSTRTVAAATAASASAIVRPARVFGADAEPATNRRAKMSAIPLSSPGKHDAPAPAPAPAKRAMSTPAATVVGRATGGIPRPAQASASTASNLLALRARMDQLQARHRR